MRFSSNLKKMLLMGTIILLGCDVSMLFAAQNDDSTAANNLQLQQLQAQTQQAQQAQQVQAQIKALQNNAPPASVPSAGSQNNLLPPAPYPVPANAAPAPTVATSTAVLPSSPLASAAPPAKAVPPAVYQPGAGTDNNIVPAAGSAVPASQVTDNDIDNAAFEAMVKNSLPMSPDQIQKLRSVYMASQYAAASSPVTPPRPTATSVFVDLAPGSTPPVVRLAQGFVSSLVFVDSSGAPWPIESYDIGNPSAFNIQWDKTSNTLMIQATVLYTYGNLAIKLKGLDTPVMLTLVPGQKAVDYRVDLRVQGTGPNARPSTGTNTLPPSTSSDLLNVLDGVPPPNSKALKVEGGNCQAWLSGDKMYVRTRLSVLSPGWEATLSSADGMHAYQMQQTPMLLVSQNGQVLQLKVEGF
jgi:intracellular multiplication protein IcmK